jgi:magnesium transporter
LNVYRIADKTVAEGDVFPAEIDGAELFIICRANEVPALLDVFGWDEGATLECTNLDENVRYTNYGGYDFTSVIHVEAENGSARQREVNLFFSKSYLVLVLPESEGARLARLADGLRKALGSAAARQSPLVYLYYLIFHFFVADFSETLEVLEGELETLAEMILEKTCREQIVEIGRLRKTAYIYKKVLRSMSYIGEQILMDENQLLGGANKHYFRNIDTRLAKQYDFAKSLYDLSNDLLNTYDSQFSAHMSETVNKLAAITLIFGSLTVIAGIYGMNFVHMPELHWPFGYPMALGTMAATGVAVFLTLKKKKWL